jgi:hypothetical protein
MTSRKFSSDCGVMERLPFATSGCQTFAATQRSMTAYEAAQKSMTWMSGILEPGGWQSPISISARYVPSIVTTPDVTSVQAGRGKTRSRCRVVDEYDGDTWSERNTRTSRRPLTQGNWSHSSMAHGRSSMCWR